MAQDLSDLYQFCTVRQLEIVQAIEKAGSLAGAQKALGVNIRYVTRTMSIIRKRAALQGHSPKHDMTHTVPDGFKVRGVSSLYNKNGNLSAQWVKSSADDDRRAEIQKAAIEAMCEDVPRLATSAPALGTLGHLCNVYTLTDSHVGMLAWGRETQSGDWDLSIAENVLTGCFSAMVDASPKAGTCVVAQLGDWMHFDSLQAVTPTNKNPLDADSRFSKMVGVAIRILRRVVDLALVKHEQVIVLLAEGNHDAASSVWLRALFRALYENEPRITVIDSELPYYIYQHGRTMIGWHHGHLSKNDQLPILFASQFPVAWGQSTKRYIHTGHRHHTEEKEHSGVTVIQHPTLAARDAYAARGGWVAERQVTSITYSDKFGQVARNTVCPEMLER